VAFFDTDDEAKKYLRNPDRPQALLCMWFGGTQQLIRAANRAGLKAKDLFLAGWGMDRHIREIATDLVNTRINLINVSWSIQEMAEVVVSRLQIHRMEPDLKPLHLAIPARLLNKKQLLALAKKSKFNQQV
jgi:DNA-binding LacI/PurR family transcriptional regulator